MADLFEAAKLNSSLLMTQLESPPLFNRFIQLGLQFVRIRLR